MLTTVSESSGFPTNSTSQESTNNVELNVKATDRASDSACLSRPKKLPYQANHQVELLHLQAELDALFQQLQSLKQQRQSPDSSKHQNAEAPALV
jgi:hypothetical protein